MSRLAVLGRLVLVLAVLATITPVAALADSDDTTRFDVSQRDGDHVAVVDPDAEPLLGMQASDPLGLVIGYDRNLAYGQLTERFDVWTCGTAQGVSTHVGQIETEVIDYFTYHSRGEKDFVLNVRGEIGSSDLQTCFDHALATYSGDATGSIVLSDDIGGGFAYNSFCGEITALCSGWDSYPSNLRIAVIGTSFLSTTAAHEIGHLVQWPHSYTGNSSGGLAEYDNASDLMSGNLTPGAFSSMDVYETAAINKYAAGWIDPEDVFVVDPNGGTATLSPTASSGTQMAVIWDGSEYYTLAARAPETFDAIPSEWAGVEVYRVRNCTDQEDCTPGFRRVIPEPPTPFGGGTPAHIIPAGGSRTVGGVQVQVSKSGSDYVVQFGAGADPGEGGSGPGGGSGSKGAFIDDDASVFEADIEWLAEQGITAGCNPPQNDRFCPNDPVTRGAMAAFLHRALPDLDDSGPIPDFTDIANSVFVSDIRWLAATGVTRGCNPPQNSRFCPNDVVTRGAMAAFLVRALDLTADSGFDFTDDDNSVFEADIQKLATEGITLGCNPPQNTRFCPGDPVTRGAMAAFLRRALG